MRPRQHIVSKVVEPNVLVGNLNIEPLGGGFLVLGHNPGISCCDLDAILLSDYSFLPHAAVVIEVQRLDQRLLCLDSIFDLLGLNLLGVVRDHEGLVRLGEGQIVGSTLCSRIGGVTVVLNVEKLLIEGREFGVQDLERWERILPSLVADIAVRRVRVDCGWVTRLGLDGIVGCSDISVDVVDLVLGPQVDSELFLPVVDNVFDGWAREKVVPPVVLGVGNLKSDEIFDSLLGVVQRLVAVSLRLRDEVSLDGGVGVAGHVTEAGDSVDQTLSLLSDLSIGIIADALPFGNLVQATLTVAIRDRLSVTTLFNRGGQVPLLGESGRDRGREDGNVHGKLHDFLFCL